MMLPIDSKPIEYFISKSIGSAHWGHLTKTLLNVPGVAIHNDMLTERGLANYDTSYIQGFGQGMRERLKKKVKRRKRLRKRAWF